MTWEELKEEAKKMGYYLVKKVPYDRNVDCLVNEEGFAFYRDGTCEFDCNPDDNLCGEPFVETRKPDQMLAIMKALQ